MPLPALSRSTAALALIFFGAAAIHAQSAAEYGIMTSNSAAAAASSKPIIPMITLPAGASGAGSGASANSTNAPVITPEAAAKSNREFFQAHAGSEAARITLHTAPVLARAWIDGRFVGPTPLDLKLAPGHHQLLVRATNMQDTTKEFDLAAKQSQPVDLTLAPAAASTVVIHWPSKK